jgi:hypothetical protein
MTSLTGILLALATCTAFARAGTEIIGALEVGPRYSAIHTMSEASGDPVAYVVRNDSAAGRRILAACLDALFCQVQVVRSKDSDDGQDMGFKEGASGWMEILEATSPRMESGGQPSGKADTRFGSLTLKGEEQVLWRGKNLLPASPGARMAFVGHYELGDVATGSDVVLVQTSTTGTCKHMLNLVAVSLKGVTVSERFGTCSDLFRVVRDFKSPVLTIHIAGNQTPANPQSGSLRNRETYQFKNGVLSKLASK